MKIDSLKLKNFRNHKKLEIDFNGRSCTIKGPNGIGKTNILEAINLLATFKPIRGLYDSEIVMHDESSAGVYGKVESKEGDTKLLEFNILKSEGNSHVSKKTIKIDKVTKQLNKATGEFIAVIFTPSDIEEIISGSPSKRRTYLDTVLTQADRNYKQVLSEYSKVIKQKNKTLENISNGFSQRSLLDVWNQKLLETGSELVLKRESALADLRSRLRSISSKLEETEVEITTQYVPNQISAERLKEFTNIEIAARRSLIGPHRDKIEIYRNGRKIENFGSRGQQRTVALTLKIWEIEFLLESTGEKPVLLLDDIFSELDKNHRDAIENVIGAQQTIITSAVDSLDNLEFEYM